MRKIGSQPISPEQTSKLKAELSNSCLTLPREHTYTHNWVELTDQDT